MKSARLLLLAFILVSVWPHAGIAGLKIGDQIPVKDVKMKNVDGRDISISNVVGNGGTLVVFACNHCPFVKAWQDRIVSLANTCLLNRIGVILINSNDPAVDLEDDFVHMKSQAETQNYRFPYVVDDTSDVARAFGARRTPEAFLFDAKGALIYHGGIDDNAFDADSATKHYLKDAIDALIAGHEVEIKETKSQGCSIAFRPKEETR
jgi:peroxiredoxin